MTSGVSSLRALSLVLALVLPGVAWAAGMTTHATMADHGRQALPDGVLKRILTAHRPALLAGAIYPDGGYGSGSAFGEDRDMAEHAHWGEFHIAFMQYLRERGCGTQASGLVNPPAGVPLAVPGGTIDNPLGTIDLAGLSAECGHLIAFAFGVAAHGITDETWDAQFEPEVRRRGEDPNIAGFFDTEGFWGPFTPGSALRQIVGADNYRYLYDLYAYTPMNAIEYAMDVVNIVDHKLELDAPTLVFPPADHLIEVYRRSGMSVGREQIERGNAFSRAAVQAQALTAPADYQRVRAHMPWSSANYYLSAGGVVSSGEVVAGMYLNMWDQLTGAAERPRAPQVVGHYPRHGVVDVRLEPADGRSWTAHRWLHLFLDGELDPDSIEQPGAFCLFDEDGNQVVVTVQGGHGWSRHWSHSTRVRLDAPLKPDHRYTAVLTTKVKDAHGRPLQRPYSWSFSTVAD